MLDSKKHLFEIVEKDKVKKKTLLEKYLILYERKENDLLKTLCDKLRLSESFIKNYKF